MNLDKNITTMTYSKFIDRLDSFNAYGDWNRLLEICDYEVITYNENEDSYGEVLFWAVINGSDADYIISHVVEDETIIYVEELDIFLWGIYNDISCSRLDIYDSIYD